MGAARLRERASGGAAGKLRGSKGANVILVVAIFVLLAIFPLFRDPLDNFVDDMILALAYVVMALGLNIVVGFAGLLDLGYVAFYAFGAYTIGWFASDHFAYINNEEGIHVFAGEFVSNTPGIHLNFILILVIAAALCAFVGTIIGLPTLRLRGDYIAIVTLAFGEIIYRFAVNGDEINFAENYSLTNGRQAISPIDQIDLPFFAEFDSAFSLRPFYWFALCLVALVLFCNFRLRDSRLGRAWIAIREDEVAAASMGVPLVKTKLLAYAAGAAFGGMAGAFLGSYLTSVNANNFQFGFSIFVLAMIILGGLGLDLGRGARRGAAVLHQLLPDPRRVQLRATRPRAGLRPVPALVRHLRLPDPHRHDPAPGRPAAGAPAPDRAHGGPRVGRRRHEGVGLMSTRAPEQDDRSGTPTPSDSGDGFLLETVDVAKIFGGLVAVSDVAFGIRRNSIASIIGPNGAGKTTFFNMLTGFYKPTVGAIRFDGQDITGWRPDKITALGVARTFQNIRLFSTMSARRELPGRPARAHAGGPLRLDPPHAARTPRGAADARRRRARCSPTSASRPSCTT